MIAKAIKKQIQKIKTITKRAYKTEG
jgi:hypothetical protein